MLDKGLKRGREMRINMDYGSLVVIASSNRVHQIQIFSNIPSTPEFPPG